MSGFLIQVPSYLLRVHLVTGRSRAFRELNDSQRRRQEIIAELVRPP
jgi:hypothetical protein